MSSNEPKDPNATQPTEVDPAAAVAAAEAALAQARAAAQAAAAARARAEALSRQTERPAVNLSKNATDKKAQSVTDFFVATGGDARPVLDASHRPRGSRVALGVGFTSLAVAIGGFIVLGSGESRARLEMAFAGSTCGSEGKQSCLSEYVLAPKFAQEAEWREEDLRAKPVYGSLELTYEPQDATVEMYQIRYRISEDDWKARKPGLGTKVCEKTPDGKENCEVPYKAFEGVDDGGGEKGTCPADKQATEIPPITGKPLVSLSHTFLPLFETIRSCGGENAEGRVLEAFHYEYRIVFTHKDYETKSVYLSQSAWNPGVGSRTLNWPGMKLMPRPETMLDAMVKFRSELFCHMKKNKLEAAQVPATVVDKLRTDNGFVTIELFDRTEALLTQPVHKAWWDEKKKEIDALKCE
jgi:hypothetical protein